MQDGAALHRLHPLVGLEHGAGLVDQIQRVGGLPKADLRQWPGIGGQGAVGGHRDGAGIGGHKHRGTATIQQAVAIGGDQFALGTGGKAASTRQALTLRRVDQKETIALYGQIESATGLGQTALAQIDLAGVGGGH